MGRSSGREEGRTRPLDPIVEQNHSPGVEGYPYLNDPMGPHATDLDPKMVNHAVGPDMCIARFTPCHYEDAF